MRQIKIALLPLMSIVHKEELHAEDVLYTPK